MPRGNGLELATQVRALVPGPHALIALSGYADDEHREAAEQAGYDFYLVKPPDLAVMRGLLDGARHITTACRRVATLSDRAERLIDESRGLINDIRADLRTFRAQA